MSATAFPDSLGANFTDDDSRHLEHVDPIPPHQEELTPKDVELDVPSIKSITDSSHESLAHSLFDDMLCNYLVEN